MSLSTIHATLPKDEPLDQLVNQIVAEYFACLDVFRHQFENLRLPAPMRRQHL